MSNISNPITYKGITLSEKHKRVVDYYLAHKTTKGEAYSEMYPNANVKYVNEQARKVFNRPEVKSYFELRLSETAKKLDIKKEEIVLQSLKLVEMFYELVELGMKDELSPEEEKKFRRMSRLIKAGDMNKSIEIVNKMLGFNEPDKVDLRQLQIKTKWQ